MFVFFPDLFEIVKVVKLVGWNTGKSSTPKTLKRKTRAWRPMMQFCAYICKIIKARIIFFWKYLWQRRDDLVSVYYFSIHKVSLFLLKLQSLLLRFLFFASGFFSRAHGINYFYTSIDSSLRWVGSDWLITSLMRWNRASDHPRGTWFPRGWSKA